MKATELRIGNYILNRSLHTGVGGYNHYTITMLMDKFVFFKESNVGEYYSKINPIPLTSEWFINFGFDFREGRFYKDRFMIEEGASTFFDNGFSFRIVVNNEESTHVCSVKYVHQLQNAYYIAKNEELAITK